MNDDRDELIRHAYENGMKKVRIAYLFRLSVGRVSKIVATHSACTDWRDRFDPLSPHFSA